MIEEIKRGNETAFKQAYVLYRARVYGYLLKKTRSIDDSADLLQTVFLKLWKYRGSLSSEYLLDQQLFHIARTVYIDHLRKQNRLNKYLQIQESALHAEEHAQISTEFDLRSRMRAILGTMPAIRKKVFELNRLEGYSYQEIATQLSISVKSVDNNLTKALRQLRKMVVLCLFFISMFQ
jgi:RNA polymerase sigma factor (sigma-70 family)